LPPTYGIDPNAPPPLDEDDSHVVVPIIQIPSQQLCLNELQTRLNPLDQSQDYGISCYVNALQILATTI